MKPSLAHSSDKDMHHGTVSAVHYPGTTREKEEDRPAPPTPPLLAHPDAPLYDPAGRDEEARLERALSEH